MSKLESLVQMHNGKNKDSTSEKYSAPALSKGLDILELLASQSMGMKKSDIAKSLNRSLSEIFRMLAVLVERNYVSLDEASETYSLTLKLFEISHRHPSIKRLTKGASDIMMELANNLNQSVHLSILYGNNILVIAQNDPPGNNITSVRLGARIPVTQTGSGAVLVHQFSSDTLRDICGQIETATEEQIEVFSDAVLQVQSLGFCVSNSMVIAGVQNISVPIFDYAGKVIAAMTIPFIQRLIKNNDPDLDTVAKAMLLAGEQVSCFLGANASRSA